MRLVLVVIQAVVTAQCEVTCNFVIVRLVLSIQQELSVLRPAKRSRTGKHTATVVYLINGMRLLDNRNHAVLL